MNIKKSLINLVVFSLACTFLLETLVCSPALADHPSPLDLWNDTQTRNTIFEFIAEVTVPISPYYVDPKDRIAVFDNDGTLWTEKPCFIQESFIVANANDELDDDDSDIITTCLSDRSGETSLAQLALDDIEAHKGTTTDEFKAKAYEFLTTANFQNTSYSPIDMTFAPMLQLLAFLRANDFDIYICSGGGIDFIRSFAEEAYEIVPQNVVGSSFGTTFRMIEGEPVLYRVPFPVWPVTNYGGKFYGGKPEGIEHYIGKKPIMAVGNSDGDIAMLQYTDDGSGRHLMMLVDHNDPREFTPYSSNPSDLIYTAGDALKAASDNNWTVISMKDDFSRVYAWADD